MRFFKFLVNNQENVSFLDLLPIGQYWWNFLNSEQLISLESWFFFFQFHQKWRIKQSFLHFSRSIFYPQKSWFFKKMQCMKIIMPFIFQCWQNFIHTRKWFSKNRWINVKFSSKSEWKSFFDLNLTSKVSDSKEFLIIKKIHNYVIQKIEIQLC